MLVCCFLRNKKVRRETFENRRHEGAEGGAIAERQHSVPSDNPKYRIVKP